MTAVIILVILAAGTGWLLWGHLKEIQAEDLERALIRRVSKKEIRAREDYDGKLK